MKRTKSQYDFLSRSLWSCSHGITTHGLEYRVLPRTHGLGNGELIVVLRIGK